MEEISDVNINKPTPAEPLTLKAIESTQRRYLNRAKRTINFRAKIQSVQESEGVLADETGTMNFHLAEGVSVTAGKTYEITGKLRVEKFRLSVRVSSANLSETPITSVGAAKLSASLIDNHSSKPIIHINALPEHRIGQSFFAILSKIEKSEGKVSAVLADNTATVQAEIATNKKWISSEVLDSLHDKAVYLCSDVILDLTPANQLIARFNHRSKITESTEVSINSIGKEDLSEHAYDDESERNALKEAIKLKDRVPKSEKPPKKQKQNKNQAGSTKKQEKAQNQQQQQQTPKVKKVRNNPIPANEPVTISNLEPWNRNQSFFGKIITQEVVAGAKINFLKGQVGDSTGVVDYDLMQKRKVPTFQVDDVVLFERAINKGSKEGKHFIEIKKFGAYTVVDNHNIDSVNKENNLSEKTLPERPALPEKTPKPERVNKPKQPKEKPTKNTNKESHAPKTSHEPVVPREQVPSEPVKINELQLKNRNQSIIGKVLRVVEEKRVNKQEIEEVHLIGAVADETGSVKFDIIKKDEATIKNDDVLKLNLITNKIVDGHLSIRVSKKGSYQVLTNVKISIVNTEPFVPAQKQPTEKRATSVPATQKNEQHPQQKRGQRNAQSRERGNSQKPRQNKTTNNNNGANQFREKQNNNRNASRGNRNTESPGRSNRNTEHQVRGVNNNKSPARGNRSNQAAAQVSDNHNSEAATQVRGNRNRNSSANDGQARNGRGNGNNQQNSRTNTNKSAENTNQRHREDQNVPITKIKELFPGEKGQNIIGVVFDIKEVEKNLNGKTISLVQGRIADETANIKFDLRNNTRGAQLKSGSVYLFKNVMNKIDDSSYHFITIGKYGEHYPSSVRIQKPNKGDGDNNLSTIAYEVKSVPNNQ